jgi:6-phosphofructokinase
MAKLRGNCVFAQSGGPTAVINASIAGAIQEAFLHTEIEEIYGAINGILGVLNEELIDIRQEEPMTINGLLKTPSSALGSCRRKLTSDDYKRIMDVFKAHNIRYFFYNGGNDSMDTANKVAQLAEESGYELRAMGIPKTIDNDLALTDHCPGYGSVIRHNAIFIRDAAKDNESIYTTDTVKVVEVMGRNTGWIAAGAALARETDEDGPHLIYMPERPTSREKLLADVEKEYKKRGRVVIAVSEGMVDETGESISASTSHIDVDSFGHKQYGGVGDAVCEIIKDGLGIKARSNKGGTSQRAAADRVSEVDLREAYQVGLMAVRHAVNGKSGYMVTLVREPGTVYRCTTGLAPLGEVANAVKLVPDEFINEEGNYVTEAFMDYAKPLFGGPLHPYVRFQKHYIQKKLAPFNG